MVGKFSMLSWQVWTGTEDAWDEFLCSFHDYSIYQSYRWGVHKARFGWRPIRLVAYNGTDITSIVQVLVKCYPLSIGVVWIPGGPVGNVVDWNSGLRAMICSIAGVRMLYCRFNSMKPFLLEDVSILTSLGWQRPASPLLSGLSLLYQPVFSEAESLKQCSGNWRHNLRRAAKYGLRVYRWDKPNVDELIDSYVLMQNYKKLTTQITHQEIVSILEIFRDQIVLVRCDDEAGNMLSFRGALIYGEKAWDIFAATTPSGRNFYASYASFWELMKLCRECNVHWYDMGGVDPINNIGVYDFKRGTGAKNLEYLGEWESSPSEWFRLAFNLALRFRGGRP